MLFFLKKILCFGGVLAALSACQSAQKKETAVATADPHDPAHLHACVKRLTDVIVYDIFTPPVASRIYAYATLAAYEAGRFQDEKSVSMAGKLNAFPAMPTPPAGRKVDFHVAGLKAFLTVAEALTFSKDSTRQFEARLMGRLKPALDEATYEHSLAFGKAVAAKIMERAGKDHYRETRGKPRYSIRQDTDNLWRPTPPDYSDAIEPYWGEIVPMALDSAMQFMPPPPYPYSKDPSSPFLKEVRRVYETGKTLTSEQQDIARFWDDNPFVSRHSGHLMVGLKKMTPGGHWVAITGLICRQQKAGWVQSARAYALTSAALLDGFISCWEEKYRTEYIRPITAINLWLDPRWTTYLQTPPFPEYTSGHGVISAAAAAVLAEIFGDDVKFHDTTELEYGHGERTFSSFTEAAQEVSISRMYGGIHYPETCRRSTIQGRKVGLQVIKRAGR